MAIPQTNVSIPVTLPFSASTMEKVEGTKQFIEHYYESNIRVVTERKKKYLLYKLIF